MSAHKDLRRNFSKHGRTFSGMTRSNQQSNGLLADGDANERTPLINQVSGGLTSFANSINPNSSSGKPLYEDDRAWVRYPSQFFHLAWLTLASNYVNVFLVFVPAGIIVGALGLDPTAVFIINFLAIVPLASLLGFATEELSVKLGETIGGLLNATFGNAVELIVSIIALRQNEILIVQTSMLGSILSNILLVLGCCFISSGLSPSRKESKFSPLLASTLASLMAVAATSLIIPATLYASLRSSDADAKASVLFLSRGTAIIMLLLYVLYLFFQMKTHAEVFDSERQSDTADQQTEPEILGPIPAAICLVIVTILVALCAEYLVDSIDSIVETAHISKTFIGLILLPIVGNAAEHVTAVVVAYKNKMDLAIGVALGSSMQIAMFVTPFLVILGWIMHIDMSLQFGIFETVVFFVSVLVVNYLISDGKSNYLEGAMCLGTYIIIALAFYVYPDDAQDIGGLFRGGD